MMPKERTEHIHNSLAAVFESLGLADFGYIVIDMDGEPHYAFQIGFQRRDTSNNQRVDNFVGQMEAMKFDMLYARKKDKEQLLGNERPLFDGG